MTDFFNEEKDFTKRVSKLSELSRNFFERAKEVDENGSFPFENMKELQQSGYTTLTIPKEFGGQEISLYELVRFQEIIAQGDGSTALSIGWHMGVVRNMYEANWQKETLKEVYNQLLNGALINGAATEPQTGSPTRGGKPQTTAEKNGENWVINGHKSFTTMSPVLDFFLVTASIKGTDEVGNFLIPKDCNGIRIENTWDSIALRGTGSNDVYFEAVEIPAHYFVEKLERRKKVNPWLLHIPACYLGIAGAAQTEAVTFAKNYSPNSINGTISDIPSVRAKIGEMELKMQTAKHFLYSVSKKWDESSVEQQSHLLPELSAVKLVVTNIAIEVVDIAMRIVGARSLSAKSPLQRYYRDVRAGLHNPPMDDMTIEQLAVKSLNEMNESK
ncbi:Putative acyl-CoA dehydrogenase YdbM [Bacillus sp. T2.9-1]|uniref:acyl-CoA dehydrogenase family protein n=1 Tax=Bacillus sp. T2.9-1 TaxID=3041163 RepID=UPI001F3EF1FA|nr:MULTISPECIES: acyl-CoA dehydrogenase family protein [Bacillaceae]CAI9385944.1 Putative acyl-CoA dehydrogenase YdbM [Bacillus sp. T2.9-1]